MYSSVKAEGVSGCKIFLQEIRKNIVIDKVEYIKRFIVSILDMLKRLEGYVYSCSISTALWIS
jgi:hypothetical protein